jgi:hypothetical protein
MPKLLKAEPLLAGIDQEPRQAAVADNSAPSLSKASRVTVFWKPAHEFGSPSTPLKTLSVIGQNNPLTFNLTGMLTSNGYPLAWMGNGPLPRVGLLQQALLCLRIFDQELPTTPAGRQLDPSSLDHSASTPRRG